MQGGVGGGNAGRGLLGGLIPMDSTVAVDEAVGDGDGDAVGARVKANTKRLAGGARRVALGQAVASAVTGRALAKSAVAGAGICRGPVVRLLPSAARATLLSGL